MRGRNQPVWLAAHGLGGSLAVLAAYRLAADEGIPIQGVCTFGQPRVGDSGFAAAFEEALEVLEVLDDGGPLYRVVYRNDIAPRLTPPYVAPARQWRRDQRRHISARWRPRALDSPWRRGGRCWPCSLTVRGSPSATEARNCEGRGR
ncbi:MAG: hypothetical protein QGH25_17160 [Candidatus Latescibacteria bacterium]|nr:hypothetical protein [Candidatus Latescibacterota bacterium]